MSTFATVWKPDGNVMPNFWQTCPKPCYSMPPLMPDVWFSTMHIFHCCFPIFASLRRVIQISDFSICIFSSFFIYLPFFFIFAVLLCELKFSMGDISNKIRILEVFITTTLVRRANLLNFLFRRMILKQFCSRFSLKTLKTKYSLIFFVFRVNEFHHTN